MSEYTAIILGSLGLMFFLIQYSRTLADGEHEILKFGVNTFGFVMGLFVLFLMNQIAEAAAMGEGVTNMIALQIRWFGIGLSLVMTYFVYVILFKQIKILVESRKMKLSGFRLREKFSK